MVGIWLTIVAIAIISANGVASIPAPPADVCTSLVSTFQFENTTVMSATKVGANTTIATQGSCQSSATTGPASICRVVLRTNTSDVSRVIMEAWLPDAWNGRFAGAGNGGLGGCIDYGVLPYTSGFGFASIGSDNGHDGNDAHQLLNNPDTILDFAFRAIHTEVIVGKALVKQYYGQAQSKSYYVGCSTGGRQGVHTAELFPTDFDGILGGAPAVDFNHLIDWSAFISQFNGGRSATPTPILQAAQWNLVAAEIQRQCDGLDGVMDNIITEPDECVFRPEAIGCDSTTTTNCLNSTHIDILHQIYEPLFGGPGELLFPRLDPGAEADGNWMATMGGSFFVFSQNWFLFTVFNTTTHDFSNFGLSDVRLLDSINPGGISTFSGDLRAFKAAGGKFMTYHGRRDQLIASGTSKRLYNKVSEVMQQPNLDDFYRLFLIPGMTHCAGGNGAFNFGQLSTSPVNDTQHNALLALVDWVENGRAPDTITGFTANGNATRVHCRFPQRSVFDGTNFVCMA